MRLVDFVLLINRVPEQENHFSVQITFSPAGPGKGEFELNLQDETFQANLTMLQGGADLALRQQVGKKLYDALFQNEIRDCWTSSYGKVTTDPDQGIRLRLWIEDNHLAALPWELLWDGDKFLATAADIALTRYLPALEPPVLWIDEKLKVLLAVASPSNFQHQISTDTINNVKDAITAIGDQIEVTVLVNATISAIQRELQSGYHGIHFLGHGKPGVLYLVEGEAHRARPVNAEDFAQLFLGHRSMRFAVLTACDSGQDVQGDIFSGVAPAFVKRQIPAVIAMQYPTVTMETAAIFNEAFYGALIQDIPIDLAVNRGRQRIIAELGINNRHWNTPVIYLGTQRGHLLSLKRNAPNAEEDWTTVRGVALQSDDGNTAIIRITARLQEIVDDIRQLREDKLLLDALRTLQDEFDLASSHTLELNGIRSTAQYLQLRQDWNRLQNNPFNRLQLMLGSPGSAPDWFTALQTTSQEIETHFMNQTIGAPFLTSLSRFSRNLSTAEAAIQAQLQTNFDDLISESERTLGNLA